MKTEKTYFVITRFEGKGKNVMMTLSSTINEALNEAQEDLKAEYVKSVEVYESDKRQYCFLGRLIFYHEKK